MGLFKSRALAGMLLVSGLFLFPVRSFGWGQTWLGISLEQIVKSAHWKAGLARYNASFRLDNAGYDSDIYYGSFANPVPDTGFTVGPDLRLFLPVARGVVFDFSEIPTYVFFAQTKRERALNNTFQGQFHLALDRFYFKVSGSFINAKERLSTELNLNIRRRQSELSGMSFWQISGPAGVSLQYRSFSFAYDNPPDQSLNFSQSLDRTESFVNFTAFLQKASRLRFFMDAEYGSFVFKDPIATYKDSRSYGIFVGIDFLQEALGAEQRRGIQGTLNLGYKKFDILDPNGKDFSGPVGNSNVSINIMSFTTFRLIVLRDIQFSAYSGVAAFVQTYLSAGLTRILTRRINLTYDLNISWNDYGQLQGPAAEGSRRDRYLIHSLGCVFQIQNDLVVRLIASAGRRSSTFFPQVFPRYFIGVDLTYGFPTKTIGLPASPFTR